MPTYVSFLFCAGNSDDGKYSTQKMSQYCTNMRRMNTEFETLLNTIQTFCDSPKTTSNIEKYNSERLLDPSQTSGQKRRRMNYNKKHHEVIPIQLVTTCTGVKYSIIAESVTGILCCNTLVANDLIPSVSLLDYIKKSNDIPESVKKSIDCPAAVEIRNAAIQPRQAPSATKRPAAKNPKPRATTAKKPSKNT